MAQSQMTFRFKIESGGQEFEVTTKPGDIVAWELKHNDTFLTDKVKLQQMMWLAWRVLFRERRTEAKVFADWFDTVDGFEVIDDEEDSADPTEADIPAEDSES